MYSNASFTHQLDRKRRSSVWQSLFQTQVNQVNKQIPCKFYNDNNFQWTIGCVDTPTSVTKITFLVEIMRRSSALMVFIKLWWSFWWDSIRFQTLESINALQRTHLAAQRKSSKSCVSFHKNILCYRDH